MPYMMTWYSGTAAPVTVPLEDVTPDGLLDAAANADLPCDWFTSAFLYRLLYHLTYQLLTRADAEVDMGDYGAFLVVPVVL